MTAFDAPIDTRVLLVSGMTCAHCELSVREELAEVPGVRDVSVDLGAGRVTVTGPRLDDDAIRAAIATAGYEVAA